MYLDIECSKCAVSNYCTKKGSSPAYLSNGRKVLCRLVGGYGREPVDKTILSEESKKLANENGPCLTIAEVPVIVGNDVFFELEKIFAPAVTHNRETTTLDLEIGKLRSHGKT